MEKRTTYLSGVAILTASTVLVKIIGFICKIPLLSLLGSEGMGYYNSACELYTLFAVISTSGLPSAMSVLTKDSKTATAVYKSAVILLVPISVTVFVVMFLFSEKIAAMFGNPQAAYCIRAVSPGVLFITLNGILKGYFQSMKMMSQTAISQIIEAVSKLAIGVTLAYIVFRNGKDAAWVSAAAMIGITSGTVLSSIYLLVTKRISYNPNTAVSAENGYITRLISLALPITLSSSLTGITRIADTALILHRLQDIGFSPKSASAVYGAYSTLTLPLFALVPAFVTAVALPLVPQIVEYIRTDNGVRIRQLMDSAIGITALFALPVAAGFASMPKEILSLLFQGQDFAINTAYPLLRLMSLSLLPSCLITVSNAILYAHGKNLRTLIIMISGMAVKFVSEYILIGIPSIGIQGAVISTVVCDVFMICINFSLIYKYSGYVPNIKLFFKPMLASIIGIGCAILTETFLPGRTPQTIITVIKISVVAVIYGVFIIATNALPDEIKEKGLMIFGKRRKNKASDRQKQI